ncbi:hypothetical protein ACWEOI_01045 [Nocardia sp. NPDC004340]
MTRLKPRKARLRVMLRGQLDQARLERLRAALGLTRMGRLTDWADEHFGYRHIGGDANQSVCLDLWRVEETQWFLCVSATDDVDIYDEEISRWQSIYVTAARAVDLEISEVRVFPPPHRDSYETTWRNENWLRTVHWDLPARSLAELWPIIGIDPSARETEKRDRLASFMTSPTWEPAPPELRQQAEEFVHRVTANELTEKYNQLRAASTAALAVLNDPAGDLEVLHALLADVHKALLDKHNAPSPSQHNLDLDPVHHYLTLVGYDGATPRPFTLDQRAATLRDALAKGRRVEEANPDIGDFNVELTELQGTITGDLLLELASRLRRGASFGPRSDGEKLAEVVTELAWAVLDQTGQRRPAATRLLTANEALSLRNSAIRLLDTLSDTENDRHGTRELLADLHLGIGKNEPPPAQSNTSLVQDPARHLRSRVDSTRTPTRPIELETEASDLSRKLLADSRTRGFDSGAAEVTVQITGLQGMIIGELLRELATRLRPGQAFGSSRRGIPLADVASDLANRIQNHTIISPE